VRPDCKKLDLWLHDHDPPSALPCKVGDRSAIGGLATADVTELVEEALAAIHFESANTLPLSRRTACTGAWEVRIWAFALSLQGMMSSACSLATMAPAALVFLSFFHGKPPDTASLSWPPLLRHQLFFQGLGLRLAAAVNLQSRLIKLC
jgi:hypothetical protein